MAEAELYAKAGMRRRCRPAGRHHPERAKMMGIEDGRAPGVRQFADIIAVDANPAQDISAPAASASWMKNGTIYRDDARDIGRLGIHAPLAPAPASEVVMRLQRSL